MGRLTNAERERAIGMILAGTSKGNIARLFGCSHVTIHALWNRYLQTGSVADCQRPGRPRVTTPRDDPQPFSDGACNKPDTFRGSCFRENSPKPFTRQ